MGRDDDVVELEQRATVRLFRKHVERRARQLAGAKRVDERVLVDELAARDVDQAKAVLGRCELVAPDDVVGVRREREVERDEVGRRQKLLERLGLFDTQVAKAVGGDVRVVREDAHLERPRPPCNLLADAAEADEPERLVRELEAGEAGALPATFFQRAWACGTFRATARRRAIVCSAADTTVD